MWRKKEQVFLHCLEKSEETNHKTFLSRYMNLATVYLDAAILYGDLISI